MRIIKLISTVVWGMLFPLTLTGVGNCNVPEDPASIHRILQKADESRGNLEGVEWLVSIAVGNKKRNNSMGYMVKSRSFDTLATATLPAKDKGNKVLMVKGNMWFYKPGLSKPVPIARRQKLIGTAAYGDIAATNYDEDYVAKPLADETFQGVDCYVFDLKAKTSKATYDRIKYWISKADLIGVRAEYYTVSGRQFKSAIMHYHNIVTVENTTRPFISEIDIQDEMMGSEHTFLTFEKPKIGRIPNHYFNINLLRR